MTSCFQPTPQCFVFFCLFLLRNRGTSTISRLGCREHLPTFPCVLRRTTQLVYRHEFFEVGDSVHDAVILCNMPQRVTEKQQLPVQLISAGNIDLSKRKPVQLPNGSYATIRSISIPVSDQNPQGHQVIIPTVHPSGRLMTDQEAIVEYVHTGYHLGIAKNVSDAIKYAKWLHRQEAKRIKK